MDGQYKESESRGEGDVCVFLFYVVDIRPQGEKEKGLQLHRIR